MITIPNIYSALDEQRRVTGIAEEISDIFSDRYYALAEAVEKDHPEWWSEYKANREHHPFFRGLKCHQ